MRKGAILVSAALLATAPPLAAQAGSGPDALTEPLYSSRLDVDRIPKQVGGTKIEQISAIVEAVRAGRSGYIEVQAIVTAQGKVTDVEVTKPSGSPSFDASVVEAIRGWTFEPAMKDGKPVAMKTAIPISIAQRTVFSGRWPKPRTTPEIRQLGHNGSVEIVLDVDSGGKPENLKVTESSRSPLIDDLVLQEVRSLRLETTKDINGNWIDSPKTIRIYVGQAFDNGWPTFGGLDWYSCESMIREFDWWRSAFSERPATAYPLRGIMFANNRMKKHEKLSATPNNDLRDAQWNAVVEECRASPKKRAVAVLAKIAR